MAYWHDASLSPDPTSGARLTQLLNGWRGLYVFPQGVTWCNRMTDAMAQWQTDIRATTPLPLAIADDELDLVIDFGTVLEGSLELEIECADAGTVAISFGESLWEAREWGLPTRCESQRPRKQHWHIPRAGRHTCEVEEGGFRFARLRFVDFRKPFSLNRARVAAKFALADPAGRFKCSDDILQRVWQSSLYTARLCTRPDDLWDGIKRDRHGWYGDARITAQTINAAWHDPQPAMGILSRLPVNSWANGIPNFSFDAITMLKDHVLTFGVDTPGAQDVYRRVKQLLSWIFLTHVGDDLRLYRASGVSYFFNIGFIDWSRQPMGGRLEHLGPVQFAWLEALLDAARLARWFGDEQSRATWANAATRLRHRLLDLFWQPQVGFQHTLSMAEPRDARWRMPLEANVHHHLTYIEGRDYGVSGPTLHSSARAVFAGLVDPARMPVVTQSLMSTTLPPAITGLYQYYLNWARAAAGCVDEAITALRDYFGAQTLRHDSPTLWESYEPETSGIAALSLGGWPKSLCHGWSSGTVPILQRYMLGIEVLEPAMRHLRLGSSLGLPCSFEAQVPSPWGPITIRRDSGQLAYRLPRAIAVDAGPNCAVESYSD